MDLQEAIRKRRTIHSFNTNEVSDQIVQRAIEAANQAPCHRHTFPWRFTNVDPKQRECLFNLALELKSVDHLENASTQQKLVEKMLNPSHLIVASQVCSTEPKTKIEDYAACACAIQNLLLSLVSDGVGSKWSTGEITTHKQTYGILEMDSKKEEIIAFLWIGYGVEPNEVKRPPITSIYRNSRF